jgi:hypothetical protein
MNKATGFLAFAGLLLLLSHVSRAQDLLLQPRANEVLLGPVTFNQTVQGVPVALRASAFLSLSVAGEQARINARIVADLSDFQSKVGALIDTIPLPTDNCAHRGFDNFVPRIWGKEIAIERNIATLTLKGDVDVWTCFPPLKTKITQPFAATLQFHLVVADPHTAAVALDNPVITLGGPWGAVTGGILKLAGVNLNDRVKDGLAQAINPDLLKRSLPGDLLPLNPTITAAELFNNSGRLAASLEMNVTIDGKPLGDLVGNLVQNRPPGSP